MHKITCTLLSCLIALTAWAIPARRGAMSITQPDGSTLTVYRHGDEFFHWMTDEDGVWLERGEDGFYRKAPALSTAEIAARRAASPLYTPQSTTQASPLNIAPRGLIILVNFRNAAFVTDRAEIEAMLNGEDYARAYTYIDPDTGEEVQVTAEGSARQYFRDMSAGQYNPTFDIVGPVTLNKDYSYYGENEYGNDKQPARMIVDACKQADTEFGVDFSLYDNDKDGEVDFVYVYYAGYGEADGGEANTIWPHKWDLISARINLVLDDKRVNNYACSNELNFISGTHAGIGAFCHEFSHVLGLPDLYTTDGSKHRTLADWDIMDYGCYNNDANTPCAYSGYERFFLGWVKPRQLVYNEAVTLRELNSSHDVLLITEGDTHNLVGNDPSPSTFYIAENRQQEGWDAYLPGHGMMLTKVSYSYALWSNNTVNNTSYRMGVDMIEARRGNSDLGKETDLFPAGATSYSGIAGHSLSDIREENGTIYFAYESPFGTDIAQTETNEGQIVGIYSLTGQRMPAEGLLPPGVYIVQTDAGAHKIVR